MTGNKLLSLTPNTGAHTQLIVSNMSVYAIQQRNCVLFEWQNHSAHCSIGLDCLISTCRCVAMISLLFWCNNVCVSERERDANRFQSAIAFWNDEIPETTKGSNSLCQTGRWVPMNELYNLLIRAHVHRQIRADATRGSVFVQLQLVCNCLQFTLAHTNNAVRRSLSQVNWYFGDWNLFLIDSVGCCVVVILSLLSFGHFSSTLFGATEWDTVQHFHWWVLNVEIVLSIFHRIFHRFILSRYRSLSPSLLSLEFYNDFVFLQLDDTPTLEYNWI